MAVFWHTFQYHIGQLYMIARHSLEQSNGGEGVEVVENTSHTDPVHGQGQYTEKRIHLSGYVYIRIYACKYVWIRIFSGMDTCWNRWLCIFINQ